MTTIRYSILTLLFLVGLVGCTNHTNKVRIQRYSPTTGRSENHAKKDTLTAKNLATKAESKVKNHTNYSVSGSDEDGNLVHGAVLIEGKAGFGSLKRIDSSTVEIIAEWSTNRKIIIATDEYGYLYRLIVEK
jgi:hypothetical protein